MGGATLEAEETRTPTRVGWGALAIPVALLLVLVGALFALDPAARLDNGAPPVEDIAFDRVLLKEGEIVLHVRNAAAAPVTIAQVIVDDAYWTFTIDPAGELGRYQAATITIEYPWVAQEPIPITLVTGAGTTFDHEIAVALPSPLPTATSLGDYALIGVLVGVVPVVIGMLFYPAMKGMDARRHNALLALTLGVLAFLAVDAVFDGLELAGELPGSLQGTGLFIGAALASILLVLGLERWLRLRGMQAVALSILIAVSIGFHNLGEGLLIGSAFALGSLTLGSTLIAGFALHNVTEGPAIVSPLTRGAGLPWGRFIGLAALAGAPTVAGAWMGAFAGTNLLHVVFFGLGAGAVLVVLVQVGNAIRSRGEGGLWTPLNMAAFGIGFALMLATAFLVA